ncbi:hypothetical protein EGR_03660 [Echinococcus granulosus]|uniref:Uncharacterized protein n=1 Tax=Echinococcus granulosus TaxID=6210 RepID=W6UKA4_ECHGR|nr:hypothetical protein EGR_03660 [Echinococcus granulosus]EUB61596.1 hypothetical protein EGR_03660 [Echinococcus granulosus]
MGTGTETDGHLARWREDWIEDKDVTNEEEVSNYQCLSNQIKHGYSIFLLWFKRNVSFIRVFIILGDVITFCIFLWVLVFATYLLTDPAIEKQHIIGIISNDTMPYPPEPEFDIQEYVSKIVAYHREATATDACCLRTTTGEKFDPYCNLYPGPLNSFFYTGCRKDVQKTIGDVRDQLTISMILLLLLQVKHCMLAHLFTDYEAEVLAKYKCGSHNPSLTTFAYRSPRHLRGLRVTSQWSAIYAEQ